MTKHTEEETAKEKEHSAKEKEHSAKERDAKGSPADHRSKGKMVIVELGSRSRAQIRRLRKGEGKLTEDVLDTIEELKRSGVISDEAQEPVVVVVKERLSSFLDEAENDDDDDDEDDDD